MQFTTEDDFKGVLAPGVRFVALKLPEPGLNVEK